MKLELCLDQVLQHPSEQVIKLDCNYTMNIIIINEFHSIVQHPYQLHIFSGGESIRLYGGRRAEDNSKAQFPTLMDDNSD